MWGGEEVRKGKEFFFFFSTRYTLEAIESSVVDIKMDKPNGAPNQVLSRRTPWVKSQDQIVQSENYCYSFLGWGLWMRIKHSHKNITMTHTQTTCLNCIALCAGKKEAHPSEVGALAPVSKNHLQNSN